MNGLIERYRFLIGGFLLVAIIVSGGYLLWRENNIGHSDEADSDARVTQLESKVAAQDAKIADLESKIAAGSNATTVAAAISPENIGTVVGTSTADSATTSVVKGKVNINTASASELDTLPGIGAAYAQRIIEYRQSHGGFKDISELKNIKGIGDKTFEKLKELVTI